MGGDAGESERSRLVGRRVRSRAGELALEEPADTEANAPDELELRDEPQGDRERERDRDTQGGVAEDRGPQCARCSLLLRWGRGLSRGLSSSSEAPVSASMEKASGLLLELGLWLLPVSRFGHRLMLILVGFPSNLVRFSRFWSVFSWFSVVQVADFGSR